MSIAAALAELERSPAIYDHLDHLRRKLEDEENRRQQFYNDLDEDSSAEFINGQIVVHSPVRRAHLKTSFFISSLLGNFALTHVLGDVYSERCLIRCRRNDYEPDICFFTAAKAAEFSDDQVVFPPPDLIVEVLSPSTESNDRTLKKADYARHGVGEYWIVDADEQMVEQYVLPPGADAYELKARLPGGARLSSVVLAGFSVLVAAFFDVEAYQRAMQELPR